MEESAKLELEQRSRLYQFYIDCYVKGIAFYLGITAALLKFALDSDEYRTAFALAGMFCSFAILVPLVFAFRNEAEVESDFQRLAGATNTKAISAAPLRMLVRATLLFWAIIAAGWIYLLRLP